MGPAPAAIQRECPGCEDEERKSIPTDRAISGRAEVVIPLPITESRSPITSRLVGRQAKGEPLAAVTRQRMGKAFGCDFSRVRIHRDAEAGEITPSAPTIQRFSYLEGKTVHPDNNLAETVLYGKDVGLTYLILNDAKIVTDTHLRAALKKPTLSVTPAKGGGFDARVQNVPINKGKVDETVLAARSWKLDVSKATILRTFPHLTACRGSGRTSFRALGLPNDPAMFTASRRHEDHHSDALSSAFIGIIYRWDTELDVAAGGKTPYHGATRVEAEAKLWEKIGGTPDQIVDQYSDAVATAIDDYHNSPKGGDVSWDPDTAEAGARCTTSSVECTNPETA